MLLLAAFTFSMAQVSSIPAAAGGGGGGTGNANVPFLATRETTTLTNDTIRLNCDASPYCAIRVNGVNVYTSVTDITAKVSGTSNTDSLYIYYTPATNTVYCDENTTSTLTVSGCTAATTGGVPAGSIPLGKTTGTFAFTANVFADPSTSAQGPLFSWANVESGTGISCTANGTTGVLTCAIDAAVVPTISDVRAGVHITVADTSASTTTYTGCPSVSIGSYTTGMPILFKPANTNTGSSTINLCALGAKTIQKLVSGTLTNLSSGDLDSDGHSLLVYNGTVFVKTPLEGGSSEAAGQPPAWFPAGYTEAVPTLASLAGSANDTAFMAFVADRTVDIRAVGIYIGTGSGTCGGTCGMKIGIYDAAGTSILAQSAVITSGGSPDLNSTGAKTISLSSTASLTKNTLYWLAITTDSTALQLYVYSGASANGVGDALFKNLIGSDSVGYGNDGTGSGGSVALPSAKGTVTQDSSKHVYYGMKY